MFPIRGTIALCGDWLIYILFDYYQSKVEAVWPEHDVGLMLSLLLFKGQESLPYRNT